MATARDPRDKRVDASTADHLAESLDIAISSDSGQPTGDVSVCVGSDLLGLVVQQLPNGVRVLIVDGEVDALTAPLLGACLSEQVAAAPAHLIVDLQAVRFLGSSGLNSLLDARERAEQTPGMQLHIAGVVTRAVARPLEMTGLLERFDTYPTVAEALTALTE